MPCALHATALLLYTDGRYGMGWKGGVSKCKPQAFGGVMVEEGRKGILLRVSRANWANGYLPRRNDLRSGE